MPTFGICADNQIDDFRVTVELAPAYEEAGFATLWLGDHTLPFQHSFGHNRSVIVEMAACLNATSAIIVGGQVIAPLGLRRHPVDVALDMATLALLHPGRVALTVGTGEAMNEANTTGMWPPARERVERCVEAIELIRRCWTETDYFRYAGRYFDSFFHLYDKPEPAIPLTCAAQGPVMAGHAGRLTDGFVAVGVTPTVFAERLLPAFERGVEQAGKDLSTMQRMVWVPVSYHPSRERAFAHAQLEAGVLIPGVVDSVLDPREMERLGEQVDEQSITAATCVATSPDEIVEFFGRYLEAGANHVVWGDLSPVQSLIPEVAQVVLSAFGATGLRTN
jgi:coenzyme F420-dependent glucose-6-phosphate dehydrogenase